MIGQINLTFYRHSLLCIPLSNPRILTRIFSAMFSLGRKNNIVIEKKRVECVFVGTTGSEAINVDCRQKRNNATDLDFCGSNGG